MRLFVAVVPPAEVVEHLAEFVGPRRDHPDEDIRWASDETWHITLAFLGDVPEYKTEELAEGLERAAGRQKPFDLRLAGSGAFPSVADARVLWTGVKDGSDALPHLAMTTRSAANKAGVTVDGRKFTPHLTLARLRQPMDVVRWVRIFDTYEGPSWTAESIELVSSRLGEGPSHGAAYDTVGEWDFLG
ncbi:RNA 2',3'-cyclic phosphodiesterase [Streptomyces sp. SID13031]|uniref:RNA 2',3'-cyclic phosphodiesterase n=1 Tax=Streptomyces sp. SID13031 TaxID=2706046 RepID=UPI0013C7359E|nr:RNA 2',3'-cyclic phosphodiesterase [Streptomyces sp. SID13031]NEA34273.1 RNA 2',3'-cyclic phosphodiesterase [Streptomyces sp. SID13031]